MKTNISLIALALVLWGCASSPEVTAYRTIGTAVVTVDSAMKGWGDYVRAGKATTENEAWVKSAYQTYQASMAAVESAVMAYKRAPGDTTELDRALAVLEQSRGALITLVNRLMGGGS